MKKEVKPSLADIFKNYGYDNYESKSKEIMKKCKLTDKDLAFIMKFTKSKDYKDLFFELENMLKSNQIMIGGKN